MLHFSTSDVHPRDRIAFWREVATRAFVRHEFRANDPSSFSASIQAGSLRDLGIASYECDPCRVGRTTLDAARDDNDDIHLVLNLAGKSIAEQDGREAVNEMGSFLLLDMRRPFTIVFDAQSKANTITIPRQLLEARLGVSAQLTAQAVEIHRPLAKLAANFLAGLPACVGRLDAQAESRLADQTLDLVALALSAGTHDARVTLSSARSVALIRLKSAIDANLADPNLKPEAAATAAGLSVRYANALLADEGTSLERHIVSRRLDRCRRALEDPAQSHRTIADIALGWGFSDLAHFTRRFKAAFGFSPREYRRFEK